jgi:DNA-binding NarL/FixJ family response regulator
MIKILLADDHSVIRSALKTIIEDNIPGSAVDETVNADLCRV